MEETRRIPAHRLVAEAIKAGMPRKEAIRILWPQYKSAGGNTKKLDEDRIPPLGTWGKFTRYLGSVEVIPPDGIPLYQPKEPLMPVEGGVGWLGILLHDHHSGLVQCHVCGGWYRHLAHHARLTHKISARTYKLQHGLKVTAALVSEPIREALVKRAKEAAPRSLGRYLGNNPARKGYARRTNGKSSFEYKNARGICPAQLLRRTADLANELKRTPTKPELANAGLLSSVEHTFGSVGRAMQLLGYRPRRNGESLGNPQWRYRDDPVLILKMCRNFQQVHKRWPSYSDFRRGMVSLSTVYKYFGSLSEAIRAAQTLEATDDIRV